MRPESVVCVVGECRLAALAGAGVSVLATDELYLRDLPQQRGEYLDANKLSRCPRRATHRTRLRCTPDAVSVDDSSQGSASKSLLLGISRESEGLLQINSGCVRRAIATGGRQRKLVHFTESQDISAVARRVNGTTIA
jgi:hypothetical protein